ncbi:kinetochore-associated protein DSN1 homolog isoform X2 [Dunckerocampus dactyliophorus]|uniref:kinetochore-associated protein DSN1 homolog isoform X2 n=1 Tax=Dunckerocampus dactyliophorus TaxID=161453 RepID=UPI00240531A2|nr:kinetochore-associated protein DSN1 homolog isoform X2 [Dunckerocampus dactyliophorus]
MAPEKRSPTDQDGPMCGTVATEETTDEGTVPPQKSPRIEMQSLNTMTPDAGEEHQDTDLLEMASGSAEKPVTCPPASPTARRKSWRRATMTRRSLPTLPNPYQTLCKSISTSLSQRERLSLLMEAAMKLAIDRLQNSLKSVTNSSPPESFQKQVENLQTEWHTLTQSIGSEQQLPDSAARCGDLAMRTATEKFLNNTNRLQAEIESWEALLQKHQSRAEELKRLEYVQYCHQTVLLSFVSSICHRKVAQGHKKAVSLDHTRLALSSQYQLIRNKPDYHGFLCRQQPIMHTMAAIMDTQCKIVRELQSIKEQSQLMVKETSGRLAAQAGFRDHSANTIKELVMATLPSTATYWS